MIFLYPEIRCPIEIMTSVLVIGCLLMIWLVFGRGWWLMRAAVLLLALLLFLPIGAYQPIVWFVVWTLATVLLLIPLRLWQQRTALRSVGTKPESSNANRWFWMLAVAVSLAIAFYCFDKIAGRTPAMGWREMSLVLAGVFFTSLLLFFASYERWQASMRTFDKSPLRSQLPKISLSEALVLTAIFALLAALVSYALRLEPIVNTVGFVQFGLLVGLMTTLVTVIVMNRQWQVQVAGAVLLVGLTLLSPSELKAALAWCMETSAYGNLRRVDAEKATMITARGFAISLAASVWIMATTGWFFGTSDNTSRPNASTKIARVAMVTLSLLVFACLAPTYVKMLSSLPPRTFESTPAERVNYRRIVDQITQTQASPMLANGSDETTALTKLDWLLHQPFAVWGDDPQNPNLGNQFKGFRLIARRSRDDAASAIADGNRRDAIGAAMRCIRLGSGLSRGGSLSHLLTGIPVEDVGYEHLASIKDQIPIDEIAALLDELANTEKTRESLASIQAAADSDCERHFGWRYRLSMVAFDLSSAKPENCHSIVSATVQAAQAAIKRRDASHHLLQTELAIRLFLKAHNRYPATLSELAPEFLDSVAQDPFSESSFIYRRGPNGYTLYSVGRDGVDDGGVFGTIDNTYSNGYDFNLEMLSNL